MSRGLGIAGDIHLNPSSPRQVLLAATGTYAALALQEKSLRENILVSAERLDWESGVALHVGSTVVLRVMFKCEPCARLNRFRDGLMKQARNRRGILTRVVSGGNVAAGDSIFVKEGAFPSFSDDWRERVINVIRSIPDGIEMNYSQVAEVAGVHVSFCRVFPRLLADAGVETHNWLANSPRIHSRAISSARIGGAVAVGIVAQRVFGSEFLGGIETLRLSTA